ncbi:MAG: hypothetical protein WDA65_03700 [Christensenellales bacterium]
MPFIDWNNNGKIDPTDIGISIGLDSEYSEDAPQPESKRKLHNGCFLTALIFVLGIVILALVIVIH